MAAPVFLQTAVSTADLATYTFAGQNLGSASATRYVIVGVHTRAAGTTALTLSSVTVGGVAATVVSQATVTGANVTFTGCAVVALPTGATGDVVVTFSRSVLRCLVGLWTAPLDGTTPYDSTTSMAADPTAGAFLDVPAGGVAFGVATTAANTTATWSGLPESYDTVAESLLGCTGAANEFASAQTPLSVTCDFAAPSESVGLFVSFGQAAVGGVSIPVFTHHYRNQGIA